MKDGMWVAITLDNLAQVHLVRGDGDKAEKYLYSSLNHGTPLYTWCEERGKEPGSDQCASDRQHLFTPIAVVRILRDSFAMEEDDGLHFARAWPRHWLMTGRKVGAETLPTHFGSVSYHLQYDAASNRLHGRIVCPDRPELKWIMLHLRLPTELQAIDLTAKSSGRLHEKEKAIRFDNPSGTLSVEVNLIRVAT